jgi:hypothetical protein
MRSMLSLVLFGVAWLACGKTVPPTTGSGAIDIAKICLGRPSTDDTQTQAVGLAAIQHIVDGRVRPYPLLSMTRVEELTAEGSALHVIVDDAISLLPHPGLEYAADLGQVRLAAREKGRAQSFLRISVVDGFDHQGQVVAATLEVWEGRMEPGGRGHGGIGVLCALPDKGSAEFYSLFSLAPYEWEP